MLLYVSGESSLVYMLEICGFEAVSPEILPLAMNVSDLVIYNIFITSGNHIYL